ncbi:Guanylyl cyclase-activating protein 3 [Clarias magur]|uniref:Guanylyl cyclase-activating protein 3 n=1 Tax=Clarias magur TaxID=1594786 RepID=A0A8J4U4E6_CLAMG|nr:Guanylyl cyclase-activating protein 3 [Clarias magur]
MGDRHVIEDHRHPCWETEDSDVKVLGLMLRCHLLCSLDRRALPDPGVRVWHAPFHLKLPLHDLEDTKRLRGVDQGDKEDN